MNGFQELYDNAHAIATKAVDSYANQLGKDHACGFAWVNIKPGTNPFCKWLVKNGLARKDSYYGGTSIWVSMQISHPNFDGQSIGYKEAYAIAFASEIRKAGFNAAVMSRLD